MRDMLSKSKIVPGDNSVDNINSSAGQADNEKKKFLAFVNDDICSAILDISFQRMQKKEKVHPQSAFLVGTLELWSDDFEGKGDFGLHRSRLVCIPTSSFRCINTTYLYDHSHYIYIIAKKSTDCHSMCRKSFSGSWYGKLFS